MLVTPERRDKCSVLLRVCFSDERVKSLGHTDTLFFGYFFVVCFSDEHVNSLEARR